MTGPAAVMETLDAYATELDGLSKKLTDVERKLEPVEIEVEEWVGDYEAHLLDEARENGERPPGEERLRRMALREMPKDPRVEYARLLASRRRLEKRIGVLKNLVDAQRSVLSACKLEMEAVR